MDPLLPTALPAAAGLCDVDAPWSSARARRHFTPRRGRRGGGWRAAVVAALGFALYEPEIFFVGEIEETTLSVMLTAAFLVLVLSPSLRARAAAGVALGLATLTRGNFLLLAPLTIVLLLVQRDERAARVGPPSRAGAGGALFTAGFLLALAPVAWRNHHLSGEWVLTTGGSAASLRRRRWRAASTRRNGVPVPYPRRDTACRLSIVARTALRQAQGERNGASKQSSNRSG